MRELIEAICKKFDASAFGKTQNGLWPWRAGQGVSLPYVVFTIGQVPVDYTMGPNSPREEVYPVTFHAWLGLDTYDSRQALDSILSSFESMIALFDDCALPMAHWQLIRCERTSHTPNPDFTDLGWSIDIDYQITIEEV